MKEGFGALLRYALLRYASRGGVENVEKHPSLSCFYHMALHREWQACRS